MITRHDGKATKFAKFNSIMIMGRMSSVEVELAISHMLCCCFAVRAIHKLGARGRGRE
jgi:hypothetical protein